MLVESFHLLYLFKKKPPKNLNQTYKIKKASKKMEACFEKD